MSRKNGHLIRADRLDFHDVDIRLISCAERRPSQVVHPEMSLSQPAQFVEAVHRTFFHFGQVGHRNEPTEFFQRTLILDLKQHVLAAGIMDDDRLLGRLVDVNPLVPLENKTAVRPP